MANSWLRLQSGAADAAWNMAVDEALLEVVASLGKPILRFYSWTESAATFGYFQKHSAVSSATLLRPLIRRSTGGGLVPHDADWTYSVAIPPNHLWYALKAVESYQRVHEWVRDAFLDLGIPTELAADCKKSLPGQCFVGYEKFDVLWHGKKIAGAAQRRTRDGLLIQGSVQPPPVKIRRADWEHAMGKVGTETHEITWADFQLTDAITQRGTELATKIYSQDQYNQRR